MKKYLKYVIGGLGFFLTMTVLDAVFSLAIDWKVNLGAAVVYIALNILCDRLFDKQDR